MTNRLKLISSEQLTGSGSKVEVLRICLSSWLTTRKHKLLRSRGLLSRCGGRCGGRGSGGLLIRRPRARRLPGNHARLPRR